MSEIDTALNELGETVALALGDMVESWAVAYGELTVVVGAASFAKAAKALYDNPQLRFVNFTDLCGADYPARAKRFDVVAHFMSPTLNQRIRLKCMTDETTPVPSITATYPGADWFEREAYDFYGILFSGHPDLRRILTDYGFRGHPLRKDFPTTGYSEVRYDEVLKRVVYEPVSLVQEYRQFDFMSPWEGAQYILPGDEKGTK